MPCNLGDKMAETNNKFAVIAAVPMAAALAGQQLPEVPAAPHVAEVSLQDLLEAESSVIERIASEIQGESAVGIGKEMWHTSSGHSQHNSSHYSNNARKERPLDAEAE